MEKNGIWQEQNIVPAFMINANRQLTPASLCNYLQNAAGNHANFRNVGFEHLQKLGCVWVLNRIIVHLKQVPNWQESFDIHTWVSQMKGPFSYRHFELSIDNQSIGSASTLWTCINQTTLRPTKQNWEELPVKDDKKPECGLPNKIRTNTEFEVIGTHKVVYSDLDMVGHVNNVKYLDWLFDAFDLEMAQKIPTTWEVNYIAECHFNHIISIRKHDAHYSFFNETTEKEVVRIVLKY